MLNAALQLGHWYKYIHSIYHLNDAPLSAFIEVPVSSHGPISSLLDLIAMSRPGPFIRV